VAAASNLFDHLKNQGPPAAAKDFYVARSESPDPQIRRVVVRRLLRQHETARAFLDVTARLQSLFLPHQEKPRRVFENLG
jgi:hypothetical protein